MASLTSVMIIGLTASDLVILRFKRNAHTTRAMSWMTEMPGVPNQAASGNGAIALQRHAESLSRAAPEQQC
jgi:hypothetical protein